MDVYPYSPEMQHFLASAIALGAVFALMLALHPSLLFGKPKDLSQSQALGQQDFCSECMDAFRGAAEELCGTPLPDAPARYAVLAERFAEAASAKAERARLRCSEWVSSIAACAVLAGAVAAMPDGGDGTALLSADNETLRDAEQVLDDCIPCRAKALVNAVQDEFISQLAGRGCGTDGGRQLVCDGIRAAYLVGSALACMAKTEGPDSGGRKNR